VTVTYELPILEVITKKFISKKEKNKILPDEGALLGEIRVWKYIHKNTTKILTL
jgi:hypothetical protein